MATHLIGIAGPSGSGKSELAHHVAAAIEAPVISLDDYYLDLSQVPLAERALVNFDEPASMDLALLLSHCAALSRGECVDIPLYDFSCHARRPGGQRIEPGNAVIIEGLFTLYWPGLRGLLHTSVYVDLDDATCYARRQDRDIRERGRTPECVQRQYCNTVRPMAERYIRPTSAYAELIVRGDALLSDSVAAVLGLIRKHGINSPVTSGSHRP